MSNLHDTTRPARAARRATPAALAALCALLAALPAALAALPAAPASAAAKHKRPRCHLSGTNLAHSTAIRVGLVHPRSGGLAMRGCVRPNGRVFTIGSVPDLGLGSGTVKLEQVAGTWVKASVESSNQYAYDGSVGVTNLRTGRGYGIFYIHSDITDPGPYPGLDASVLDRRGRTAAAEHVISFDAANHAVTIEQIEVFAPDGTALILDSGDPKTVPAASLSFSGGVIGWTHGAEERTARFR